MAPRASALTPSRAVAFAVVRRVFEQGAYADRALAGEAAGMDDRDRALATQIAYGTVQRRATLDHVAERLVERRLDRLEPAALAALRIGLFQLLFLDGVAPHAAVSQSVELAKRFSRGGGGLVNAVLRRAAAGRQRLLADLDDATAAGAAVMHSVPVWLAEMWWEELGPAEARALLLRVNEPAESALRVNTLAASAESVLAELPVAHHPAPEIPEGVVLEGPFDIQDSPLWRAGLVMAQSRGSMLVARVVDPRPGERVLDLCAAPGAKTTHLAALMQGDGAVLAVERHPGRASALQRTAQRMHAGCVAVRVADAEDPVEESFDRVLVDPPCSGLGTLQSRPDLRWRAGPAAVEELAALQSRILLAGAAATAPGGVLVYSVCTISRREGEDQIARFLSQHPSWAAEDLGVRYPAYRDSRRPEFLQLLPHRDLTDGFFLARLRRARG